MTTYISDRFYYTNEPRSSCPFFKHRLRSPETAAAVVRTECVRHQTMTSTSPIENSENCNPGVNHVANRVKRRTYDRAASCCEF